jgi:hypothetical protein
MPEAGYIRLEDAYPAFHGNKIQRRFFPSVTYRPCFASRGHLKTAEGQQPEINLSNPLSVFKGNDRHANIALIAVVGNFEDHKMSRGKNYVSVRFGNTAPGRPNKSGIIKKTGLPRPPEIQRPA